MRKSDFLSLDFSNGGLFSSAGPYRHSTRVIDSMELIVVTGGTPYMQQDITPERLERAKLLLQTNDFTIKRIAHELGYESANLFVKFFRYHLKTTPTAFRNSYSKIHTNHK